MANLNPFLAIKTMVLDPANFLTVTVPIDCDSISVKNKALIDLMVRTDPADSTTEDTLPAGMQETYTSPKGEFSPGTPRYKAGSSAVAIKPASGTGPAILKFLT